MTSGSKQSLQEKIDGLHSHLASKSLIGLWQRQRGSQKAAPRVWRWADILSCLEEAGEVVDLGSMTHRRVLGLMTPEIGQETSKTLSMFFQYIKPGEQAEAHRHTAAALRFVVQGSGTYTTVEGERMHMEPGDLILTPNWAYHDHTNESDEPMIWIDGLDVGLVGFLDAMFSEPFGEGADMQPITKPDGYSRHRFGPTRPRTASSGKAMPYNYKWSETERAFAELAEMAEDDPYDGLLLEYTNPLTGGPTFPTMTCFIQMLRPGERTKRHRHTGSALYHTFKGHGISRIGDQEIEWGDKDCFFTPPWQWHEHENTSKSDPAYLFSMNDRPVLEGMGLFREEGE